MKITWTTDYPDAEFSSYTGFDADGNEYHENASRETVTVKMKDGRTGMGWTSEEALREAQEKEVPVDLGPFFAWSQKAIEIAHHAQLKASIEFPALERIHTAFHNGQTSEVFAKEAAARIYAELKDDTNCF